MGLASSLVHVVGVWGKVPLGSTSIMTGRGEGRAGAFAALPVPSGALSLGMSAGMLMWTGAAEASLQLVNPHVRAASALLSAVAGGALLVLLWRAYGSASTGLHSAPLKKTDEDLEAPVVVVATAGSLPAAPYQPSSGGWELVGHMNGCGPSPSLCPLLPYLANSSPSPCP